MLKYILGVSKSKGQGFGPQVPGSANYNYNKYLLIFVQYHYKIKPLYQFLQSFHKET